MSKMKLLLTIIYVLFAYSCTERIIYSGKIINQANIDYSVIKDKSQLINELGKPSYIDPIKNKYFYYSQKKIYKNFFDQKLIIISVAYLQHMVFIFNFLLLIYYIKCIIKKYYYM